MKINENVICIKMNENVNNNNILNLMIDNLNFTL